jgi:outer membrane protein OmpA-like peptidoglycan-associated protein
VRKKKEESNWISISDMMTGLMVIFMFVAINYIVQVIEYKFVEKDVYNALLAEFIKEIDNRDIQLGPDGSVTFNPENRILFTTGSAVLTNDFDKILDDFVPRYLKVITKDEYIDYIKEIRIEGHTDTVAPKSGEDSYTYNLRLSSSRAQSVLQKLRNMKEYQSLQPSLKDRLQFLFTANGLSYSRALNSSGQIFYSSPQGEIDNNRSRRVEFRVVTSNEKLVEEIYNDN